MVRTSFRRVRVKLMCVDTQRSGQKAYLLYNKLYALTNTGVNLPLLCICRPKRERINITAFAASFPSREISITYGKII